MEGPSMGSPSSLGPDIVIAGAARSGTSYLAAVLGAHPDIDPGAVKEPNYFSREHERGPRWYDDLYEPRRDGLLRLDGSMSYTFPHFPEAIPRLAAETPKAYVIYSARDPLVRTLSHYQLHRDYFGIEAAQTFGEGLASNPVYIGTSEYDHWLSLLYEFFPADRVLLVPFDVVTQEALAVAARVCDAVGLAPPPADLAPRADAHRNEVVQFRSGAIRWARRLAKRSGAYPWIRRTVGTDRLRRMRSRMTRKVTAEGMDEALATCGPAQLAQLRAMHRASRTATAARLREQDARLGLDWAAIWERSCPSGDPPALATSSDNRE
jgi:Sulfotransferase family